MTPRRWYAITTMMMLAAVPAFVGAAGNEVQNGECEDDGTSDLPTDLPGWFVDSPKFDVFGITQIDAAFRGPGLGADGTDGCVLLGPAVLRSPTFTVGTTTTWSIEFDVYELRDDAPTSLVLGEDPDPSRDSVLALEFFSATGAMVGDYVVHCDDWVDRYDIATGTILVQNLNCDTVRGMESISWPSSRPDVAAKYRIAPSTPAGAESARVLIGGSLATDTVEPIFTDLGVNSPTAINIFDNIVVEGTA